MCVLSAMLTLLRFCFSVLCVCIYIISIIVISIYYTIDCCLLCQSWWHFSPLIGVVTCSYEHLCVVAVPTTGCFQYVCHLSYFCSIRGIATCCGDNVCTVCHAYPAAFLFFSVLCVCIGCLVWCLCPELYSQPGFWILTIFPVSFQFFFVLILMPPKRKRSEQQRQHQTTSTTY